MRIYQKLNGYESFSHFVSNPGCQTAFWFKNTDFFISLEDNILWNHDSITIDKLESNEGVCGHIVMIVMRRIWIDYTN